MSHSYIVIARKLIADKSDQYAIEFMQTSKTATRVYWTSTREDATRWPNNPNQMYKAVVMCGEFDRVHPLYSHKPAEVTES